MARRTVRILVALAAALAALAPIPEARTGGRAFVRVNQVGYLAGDAKITAAGGRFVRFAPFLFGFILSGLMSFVVAGIAFIYVMATISFRFFESPFLKLKGKFHG